MERQYKIFPCMSQCLLQKNIFKNHFWFSSVGSTLTLLSCSMVLEKEKELLVTSQGLHCITATEALHKQNSYCCEVAAVSVKGRIEQQMAHTAILETIRHPWWKACGRPEPSRLCRVPYNICVQADESHARRLYRINRGGPVSSMKKS